MAMATKSSSGTGTEEADSTLPMRLLRRLSLRLLQPSAPEGPKRLAAGLNMDVAALAAYMRGRHQDMQDWVHEFFAARPELQTPVEMSPAAHQELCIRQMSALARDGGLRPLSLMVADPAKYFAVVAALGLVDVSLAIKFGPQFNLWGGSVINLGTKKHKEKYFDKIDNLEYPGCFAMTELHHGSNVQALQTTATFDPVTDEFIIDTPNDGALKWWIGLAPLHAKFCTVLARLILPIDGKGEEPADMGIHAFIVPIRELETHVLLPGIEIKDCGTKIGVNGVDTGAMRFSSVRIPRDNLLNRFGDVARDGKYTSSLPTINRRFAAILGELLAGRVGIAYCSVPVLKVAVTIAVRYALLRQQFGPPNQPEVSLLDYQSHQHKLMPMLASAYAFHFASTYLLEKYSDMKKTNDEDLIADVHVLTSGLKAYITSYISKSISICRESCGGHGYAAVNRFGSIRNDIDIFQTFEGDNTVLLQQVARYLLKQYEKKIKGGTLAVTTWNYLRDSMSTYLSKPNVVTARWEGEDHLRDPNFQLDALRYRTSRLLHSVAARLQKHIKTLGGFGAWNLCLNHLLTLAESHIEFVILDRFIEAMRSCPDEKTREVLKLLCDLYALDRIWKDIGTYRNFDYIAPNKAKAIRKLVDNLSYQVRLVSHELVNAFDIPDQIIRAPIGLQSEAYAKYSESVGF